MSKKTRKDSIYVIYEGFREECFLDYLASFSDVRYNPHPCNGGSANQIVTDAIKYSDRNINVYVVFDEDFESKLLNKISDEAFEGLANVWRIDNNLKKCAYRDLQKFNKNTRNPILIVSYPNSIDGFLLRLLGCSSNELKNKTTKELKNSLAGYFNNNQLTNEDNEKIDFYKSKINKYSDEIARLQQSEPYNKNQCKFMEAKIKEYNQKISKVEFIRFLIINLPLTVITAKRTEILELDILLNAFKL